MTRVLRVAIIQLAAYRSKEESYKRIEKLLVKSLDYEPDLIVLPEYAMFDPTGLTAEEVYQHAETIDGPWSYVFDRVAGDAGVTIVYTLFEKRRGYRKAFNTAVLLKPDGEIEVYRKTHLFDSPFFKESSVFERGDRLSRVVDVRGFRVGMAMCFEIRFPEVFRILRLKGADIVVVPSAWYKGPVKEEQYQHLAAARSHENTVYIVAPILYGEHFTGRSLVADPYGVIRLDAGLGEKIVSIELDSNTLEEARRLYPLLEQRRPELYTGVCSREKLQEEEEGEEEL